MVKEKVIQGLIENMIAGGDFHTAIRGAEVADASMYSLENESFIPNFPIDFLMRQRCLEVAQHVLSRLHRLEQVSTSAHSISLEVKERLFPDLICCNVESGSLVLIEIKRSKKTERETATEILAYEHEIRNHLPFLSSLDICHVIVATEFDSLLDHSIAGMVTWSNKQILCLHANFEGKQLNLTVHIPNKWTSIGQKPIPEEALLTVDLHLHPFEEDASDSTEIYRAAETALNLFAREGDRYQSHGFAMLWRDLYGNGGRDSGRLALTVGFVNPYPFMDSALACNMIQSGKTRLLSFVTKAVREFDLSPREAVMEIVCKKGLSILAEVCIPRWESFTTWKELRTPKLDSKAKATGLHWRALPIQFEFWGAIGDFARQYITMPAVRESFNVLISRDKLDWRDPIVAIELLDRLIGAETIKNGRFTCSAMFWLGVEIASFATINWTMQCRSKEGLALGNMPALLMWYGVSLATSVREITYRWEAILDDMPAPPAVNISAEDGFAKVEEIEDLAKWISATFLDENPLHQQSFSIGLSAPNLLNAYFRTGLPRKAAASLKRQIVQYGRVAIELGVRYYNQSDKSGDNVKRLHPNVS